MAYMLAAYSVAWVIIFVYLLSIGKRQSKIVKEMEFIKEMNK
ncbi:CcmD family protein [Pseudoneobacillus sp. C159]